MVLVMMTNLQLETKAAAFYKLAMNHGLQYGVCADLAAFLHAYIHPADITYKFQHEDPSTDESNTPQTKSTNYNP